MTTDSFTTLFGSLNSPRSSSTVLLASFCLGIEIDRHRRIIGVIPVQKQF